MLNQNNLLTKIATTLLVFLFLACNSQEKQKEDKEEKVESGSKMMMYWATKGQRRKQRYMCAEQ